MSGESVVVTSFRETTTTSRILSSRCYASSHRDIFMYIYIHHYYTSVWLVWIATNDNEPTSCCFQYFIHRCRGKHDDLDRLVLDGSPFTPSARVDRDASPPVECVRQCSRMFQGSAIYWSPGECPHWFGTIDNHKHSKQPRVVETTSRTTAKFQIWNDCTEL